jgi:hypothetical protein
MTMDFPTRELTFYCISILFIYLFLMNLSLSFMIKKHTTLNKNISICAGKLQRYLLTAIIVIFTTGASYGQMWDTIGHSHFTGTAAQYTTIAIDSNNTPYIACQTYLGGAEAWKFNGTNWVMVGSPGFTGGGSTNVSLALDGSGVPYVAYTDLIHGSKASVKKYNGSYWAYLGSYGFSDSNAIFTTLAIDKNGTPYVAYQDWGHDDSATVMKYDGSNWVVVGAPAFSTGKISFLSFALDTNGTPYVAFSNLDDSSKATVMKFDGSSWVVVGNPGFSASYVGYLSLAFDKNNTPFLAFEDGNANNKATVMKYDGSSWVTVGSAGFSGGSVLYPSLAIDKNGTPYVAYEDQGTLLSGATVMRYDGSNWVNVGNPGFSSGWAEYTSVALDKNGRPYVVYKDNQSSATVMTLNLPAITGVPALCAGTTTTLSDSVSGGSWLTTNANVATIDTAGLVHAISPGVVTLVYMAYGVPVAYTLAVDGPANAGIITSATDSVCVQYSLLLSDTITGGLWSSENTSIATIDAATGLLTGIAPGIDTIKYHITNTCGSDSTTKAMTVRVCATEVGYTVKDSKCIIRAYPNPNQGAFMVNLISAAKENAHVTLTNILGEKVKEWVMPTNAETEVRLNASPGIYFLSATTSQGSMNTRIVIDK